MFGWLKQKIPGLFKRSQERCLVVEEHPHYLEVTYAKLNSDQKKIFLVKRQKIKTLKELRRPFFILDRFILALDSHQATTIESVVRLKRQKSQEVITEGELDHLVFKCLWEFLNHYRGWAARKMNVSELDLVLTNVEIRDVGLGSHRMLNPLGFKGSDFFLRLCGTFIPRAILELTNPYRKWTRDFLIVEAGSIISASIPDEFDFVVQPAFYKTAVFASTENERLFSRELPWGFERITAAIAQTFGVTNEIGEKILDKYLNHHVSLRVHRLIQSLINKEFKNLLDLIDYHYNKQGIARLTTYFNFGGFRPPEFMASGGRRLTNFAKWLELKGFSLLVKFKEAPPPKALENTLALLTHNYHHEHYSFLNQLLKRRARWLTVSG